MVQRAVDNGLLLSAVPTLKNIASEHIDVSRTAFSLGPLAKFDPLKNELVSDTNSVRVHLLNHLQKQRELFSRPLEKLVSCGMLYPNSVKPWASPLF